MAKKNSTADGTIQLKPLTVEKANTFTRYNTARPNYKMLAEVFADSLEVCPDFLDEVTTEKIIKLDIRDFRKIQKKYAELIDISTKEASIEKARPVKFAEKLITEDVDDWFKATVGKMNFYVIARAMANSIQTYDGQLVTHESLMQMDYIEFTSLMHKFIEHVNAVTSKN